MRLTPAYGWTNYRFEGGAVQAFVHRRFGLAKELLQQMDEQHHLKRKGRASALAHRSVRRTQEQANAVTKRSHCQSFGGTGLGQTSPKYNSPGQFPSQIKEQ